MKTKFVHMGGFGFLFCIIAGLEAGLDTVLVLSGCTAREDVDNYPYRPTYILNGVGEIAQ